MVLSLKSAEIFALSFYNVFKKLRNRLEINNWKDSSEGLSKLQLQNEKPREPANQSSRWRSRSRRSGHRRATVPRNNLGHLLPRLLPGTTCRRGWGLKVAPRLLLRVNVSSLPLTQGYGHWIKTRGAPSTHESRAPPPTLRRRRRPRAPAAASSAVLRAGFWVFVLFSSVARCVRIKARTIKDVKDDGDLRADTAGVQFVRAGSRDREQETGAGGVGLVQHDHRPRLVVLSFPRHHTHRQFRRLRTTWRWRCKSKWYLLFFYNCLLCYTFQIYFKLC